MSVINNAPIIFQFMSIFMWVGILSSLVIYLMTCHDVYLHRWGGANLYVVSGRYLLASVMASNYTMFALTLAVFSL